MAANLVKVVLDTNVLLSALIYGGKPEQIYRLVLTKKIRAIASPILLAELLEILTKKSSFYQREISQIMQKIRKSCKIVHPKKTIAILKDDDDNRVLEAATTGSCDFIVTGDRQLLDLKEYKRIKIVTPHQFLRLIEAKVETY